MELAGGRRMALHPPVREVDGVGILSTAGSGRRWNDKDTKSDKEFPTIVATVSSNSGKPERLKDSGIESPHQLVEEESPNLLSVQGFLMEQT